MAVLSIFQTNYKKFKQPCSPCPESSLNWPNLSSPCFSPLAAHWFTNTVQTCFSVLQLRQLDLSWPLDWTKTLLTNPRATLLFVWYLYSLSSLYAHARTHFEVFFMVHRLSGTLSLAKLGHLKHALIFQIILCFWRRMFDVRCVRFSSKGLNQILRSTNVFSQKMSRTGSVCVTIMVAGWIRFCISCILFFCLSRVVCFCY